MLRGLFLRILFIKTWLTRRNVHFKGWCVVHAFPGRSIAIGGHEYLFKLLKQYDRIVPALHHCGALWR